VSVAPPDPVVRDVRGSDLAVGLTVALAVLVGSAVTLETARLRGRTDAPPIDPGLGVPISIRPILDAPTPRGDGDARPGRAVVPEHWARAPRPSDDAAAVPSAEASPAAPSPRAAPSPPGATASRPASRSPSAPGALPSLTDPGAEADPEVAPDPDGPGAPSSGTPGASASDDPEPGGAGGGAADGVLAARAIEAYRDRLSRWLSSRFTVTGSGLSRAALLKHRVRAIVRVGADGTVESFEVIPSGNDAFDRGAREALESVRGEPLPTPPDHYPSSRQRELKVTFVCRESQCD